MLTGNLWIYATITSLLLTKLQNVDHGDPTCVTSDDTVNDVPILPHFDTIDLETPSDYPRKSPLKQRAIPLIRPMTPRTALSQPRRRRPSNDLNPDDLELEKKKFVILDGR